MSPPKHDSSKKKRLGNATIVAFKRWLSLRPKLSLLIIATFVSSILYLQPTAVQLSTKLLRSSQTTKVPECPASPWKENESLHGNCQGSALKLNPGPKTATECASTCCDDPKCITFQYRSDTGCYQGDDVRLGFEKDGEHMLCTVETMQLIHHLILQTSLQERQPGAMAILLSYGGVSIWYLEYKMLMVRM